MALEKYKSKRNFKSTREPEGKVATGESSRFVVQKHQASHLHFDFRLEAEGVLKSWAVPKGIPEPGEKRLAMMVEDHPIEYQNFEGTIPVGNYGAGTVMIWDRGIYTLINKKSVSEGIEKGEFSFKLNGAKLQGEYSMVKLKKGAANSWLMICKKAEVISESEKNFSAASGLSMEQIGAEDFELEKISAAKAKPMPEFIKPMLSIAGEKSFDDKQWLFENKWDGYRAIAIKNKKQCHLFSRNKKNFDEQFNSIFESLKKIEGDFILDGEVIAIGEKGKSSFQLLQNYLLSREGILIYYVFDILYLNGFSLMEAPLLERKKLLKKFLPKISNIKISEFVEEKGQELFKQVSSIGSEGIMGKKIYSKYLPGVRSPDWIKIKSTKTQEAIIVGFTQPKGGRKKFGALILAVYKNNELKYIGHTGGGFDDKTLSFVEQKLKPLIINQSPLKVIPKTNAPATWVRPELIAEIKFSEWTQEGVMRQPIFLGLREDKSPQEIKEELKIKVVKGKKIYKVDAQAVEKVIDGKKLKLTNLEKVFWPQEGYTKADLIDYYLSIADIILPYLKDRPQSLNRFPNGIEGESFFHKDITDAPSWIKIKKIFSDSEDKQINYMLCQKAADLIYMINLGCIEINPWNSRIQSLDKPDYLVFDIDPLDAPFSQAVSVALEVKKILDEIKVEGYCKTSGSRGLHVYVPVGDKYEYEFIKEFCHLVNLIINFRLPETTSLERNPQKRKNKVYLDFLQNRKGQTMAAPYSVRPRPGATVSTPLEWSEVNEKLNPLDFNLSTMSERIKSKGDLWKATLNKDADLNRALNLLSKMLAENRIK